VTNKKLTAKLMAAVYGRAGFVETQSGQQRNDTSGSVRSELSFEICPRELSGGGWRADFVLVEDFRFRIVTTNYEGQGVFPTREVAAIAAICSAKREIQTKS